MIYPGKVPRERFAVSQHSYNQYSFVNGFSYMCLGETVLILLAVKIGSPDYLISALGAMIFIGFVLLPLGKKRCARKGAAASLADFWVARNVAALLVAGASVLAATGMRFLGLAMLLIGAFLFYGFRAAGVVLAQPLMGAISDAESSARLIGQSNGVFYISSVVALVIITLLLHFNSSIWCLTFIIVAGAMLGVFASTFLRRIDEPASLRESSRKPLLPALRGAGSNTVFMRQLVSGTVLNIAFVMIVPLSMAALKRGCGVSDADALLFSLLQFAACGGMSFCTAPLNRRFGPRKSMLYAYCALLAVALVWFLFPKNFSAPLAGAVFLTVGAASIAFNNAVAQYYLRTIAPEKQVSYSIVVALVTNVGAGVFAMLLSGTLLYLFIPSGAEESAVMQGYRYYFGTAFLLLLPGMKAILRLTPLSEEQRRKTEHELRM